jgi:hypothetical protein
MSKHPLRAAVLAALVVSCASAYAQTPAPIGPYTAPVTPTSGPAGIRLGDSSVLFIPFLNVGAGYDDNVGMTATNETSSPFYVISPGFVLESRDASRIFKFSYQGAIGQYSDSEADNYVDHTFRGSLDWAISQRQALRLGYDYIRGHEARGATDRPEARAVPTSTAFRRQASCTPLARRAPRGASRPGTTMPASVTKTTARRRSSPTATPSNSGDVLLARHARTHVLFEASSTDFDYKSSASGLDSRENRVYVGATWEATAATSGTVKIGSLRKKFDAGPKDTGTAWEGLVTWNPRTYSRFDFYTSRQPTESTGLGAFIISEAYGVVWTHAWSSLVSTTLNARFQNDEYKGATREDDIKSIGAKCPTSSAAGRRWAWNIPTRSAIPMFRRRNTIETSGW